MMKITKVSTKNMPREEWLELRKKTVGGSDAGAVMGVNEYKSAYTLWAEKTGKIPEEDLSEKESVRLGNDLEDYVARRWMEATGKKLERDNHTYYNSEFPFAHANLDRRVVGEPEAGFEAKTTSSWKVIGMCKAGEYPTSWYAQCQHYMMVTGRKKWYLGVLCFGDGLYTFEIPRNEDDIKALAAMESAFYQCMVSGKPPALDGSEDSVKALSVVLGDSSSDMEVDLGGVRGHVYALKAARAQMKQAEKDANFHKGQIMAYMGAASYGTCDDIKVRYKTQKRKNFDRKRFEVANGVIPAVYFNESVSRPFNFDV